jgi:hypothetical protein
LNLGSLDFDGHIPSTAPPEGVINNYGDRVREPVFRVNVLPNCLQRSAADFIRRPAHYVVVFLRVLIDDADAGAGGEIVELIEEDFLPILSEFFAWIFFAVEPRERCPLLGVEDFYFGVAVKTPRWYSK